MTIKTVEEKPSQATQEIITHAKELTKEESLEAVSNISVVMLNDKLAEFEDLVTMHFENLENKLERIEENQRLLQKNQQLFQKKLHEFDLKEQQVIRQEQQKIRQEQQLLRKGQQELKEAVSELKILVIRILKCLTAETEEE